ncbi:o-succinylbenzoate synthase [Thermobispora bispora]|jgi:O-succinylbenzoate synthase|uniref:O-succinylbenzoate-CoA synthase n=1 Tax=Thermobispora bispora (strain ATCC 19993 / DSM 43833 / CBS 139.67 / JCM 10125 / KCTC 9307 / NBRC 14880 / R51) TaxID=469371 RepID=D6Y2N2_THEBD|nr:enolase C-terminal domain-like protein [Thermobispora bispora]ADG88881.1 O-succinylbenzoate-CoA synthase [Thermobispora bispora DSM 43833]MBO2473465.1 O-succinylbenzoate-CoA synthase [Actinomycetales bacterium]MBX6169477.1 O-succinylbenzoate-CoA synthase [Thermobispora bispora]QSI48639.1 O-succinylbenzoate-CoA synthase [Thermobispora bispora]
MPRIRELEIFRIALPYGRRPETVLVKLTDYGGMVGWGEAVEPVTGEPLERSLPKLIGVDWEHPSELGEIPGGTAGDMACWDLWGRMNGVPLAHALGGNRTSLIATVRLGSDRSLDSLIARVNRHVCAGYSHVTIDIQPGWDIEPLRAVRAAYPGLAIAVDARHSYTDTTQLEALDAYGVATIERPFKDLLTSADLQDRVSAAVAVEVGSVEELDEAVRLKAGRALMLRPARFASLAEVRRAHDRAVAAGWDILCAGGLGAGLARAATVAVASLPGCTLPSDVAAPPRSAQVVLPPVGATGGVVAVPLTQPGLGHTVDEERVRRLAHESFRA